jgi:hypothetical protein
VAYTLNESKVQTFLKYQKKKYQISEKLFLPAKTAIAKGYVKVSKNYIF